MPAPTKSYIQRKTYRAKFQRHNGTTDSHGAPTYPVASDWDQVVAAWPCELITTTGGERIRGRQVSPSTSHILVGQFSTLDGVIGPGDRAVINGKTYNILAVYDPDGLRRSVRVEARQSW